MYVSVRVCVRACVCVRILSNVLSMLILIPQSYTNACPHRVWWPLCFPGPSACNPYAFLYPKQDYPPYARVPVSGIQVHAPPSTITSRTSTTTYFPGFACNGRPPAYYGTRATTSSTDPATT